MTFALPRRLGALLLLSGSAGMASAQSASAVQPPPRTAVCVTCHGPLGMGAAPDTPHLAAQPEIYLVAQLKAFRSGARKHEVMNVIARSLSDEDIAALADWYSRVKIEVRAP